jgi:hypothetical protein
MSTHANDAETPTQAHPYLLTTHEVTNQPGAWVGVNAFEADHILTEIVRREVAEAFITSRLSGHS